MTSLRRSRARAARARAEQAASVIERMQEEEGKASSAPVVIVKSSRDSWGRPEWLIPLGILLAAVLAANTLGYWPFRPNYREYSPAEIERGRRQLLEIEVLRIQAVTDATGQLPESLDEIQPGLDSVMRYEALEDGRFELELIGDKAGFQKGGRIYDAATGERQEADEER